MSSLRASASPHALDPLEGQGIRLDGTVADLLELSEVLFRPLPPVLLPQPVPQPHGEGLEEGGVRRGVRDLGRGERPPPPVGSLVALVQHHFELFLEQGGETGLGLAEDLGHDLGVHQPADADAVVAVEHPDVVVRSVHQHRKVRILDQPPQRPELLRF